MATQVSGYVGYLDPGTGTNYAIGSTAYGYCQTAAGTKAKVVDMTGFTLNTGATIHVKFQYTNTATNPTLNVNSTGAKNMYRYGTTIVGSTTDLSWDAGSVVTLTYDGTGWVMDSFKVPNANTTYTFANGTNGFTVTPSGGSAQTVTVTPSITNNVTGSGTSGSIAKFDGTNTITDGPAFGSDTTKYLRNDGEWVVPPDTTYTAATATPSMDGTGAVGSSVKYAREDHVHPSDTSRVPTSRTVNGHALSSNVTITASDVSAVATSSVGAASGVASLDTNGRVPNSQLPCDVVNTVSLSSSSWTSDTTTGYYKQTVSVSGMTANSHPDAKIKYPSGTTELTKAVIDEAANLLVEMETASGSVTFYAVSAPASNLTLYLKGV